MAEGRCIIGFKIAEFFQKFTNLHYDAEDVLVRWMVVHAEPFHLLVVFNYRVKALLLEFLPVSTELIFIVGVKEQQKVFNVGDHSFEFEVISGTEEVISLLLELSN